MLTLLFMVLMVVVFGKLLVFALKASWGIVKVLLTIVFLPLVLVCLVLAGLVYVAVPVLLVVGLFSMVRE